MGGYAWFLWPAYAATFAVLLINIWSARKAHTEARREAQRRLQINEGEEL
jgi:heme exporter protein CcmD